MSFLWNTRRISEGGPRFQVVAKDRAEALELGEKYIRETLHEHNAINGSLKVVRKLKPSFSKELA